MALAGNPNCGKTTMFNALTGATQYVGNWPGVTVEKKEGRLKGRKDVTVTDLPGVYSLSPYTLEEVVARDYLVGERPSVIVDLVDATNIERNLYLTTQLLEVGIPVVVALNMIDLIRKNGVSINVKALSKELGCPVVETSALKNEGLDAVITEALDAEKRGSAPKYVHFAPEVEKVLSELEGMVAGKTAAGTERYHAIKLFERDEKVLEHLTLSHEERERAEELTSALERDFDDAAESIITGERYERIGEIIAKCVTKKPAAMTVSDKIDRVVTNRVLALPIFAVIMTVVYYVSISTVGDWTIGWVETFFEWVSGHVEVWLTAANAPDWLLSLIIDGIIGGVGSVLVFVPQMMILFIFLSVLEDCGYMARVAFIMDRIFRKFGLSGKSFIPMLISSGCGVPGVMATRTIENEKDRRMTAMTTTFIPCGAKMPIISMIAGSLFGGAWWVAPSCYFIGIAVVVFSGIVLKKTKLFAGDPAPFVMELPQYHIPSVKGVLIHMWERAKSFMIKAGTIIFVACAAIWFLQSFGFTDAGFGMVETSEQSMLAAIGRFLAPIFVPLGFGEWESTVAAVTGLVAKEQVVGTLGVLLHASEEAIEMMSEGEGVLEMEVLVASLFGSGLAGFAYMVFNLICAPCFAAIGAVRREIGGKWALIAVTYQTLLAYSLALIIYQVGSAFAGNINVAGFIVALVLAAVLVYALFRPNPYKKEGRLSDPAVEMAV